MAEIIIREPLWRDLVVLARKKRKKPELLASEALRSFVERLADEELLARSSRAARRSRFPVAQTEELVRRHRRRKARA
jgi:hypothetical protein